MNAMTKHFDLTYSQKKFIFDGVCIYDLDRWIKQNAGEYSDYCEGCLLDNYVISCKRGTAFVYEKYLNSNSSGYIAFYISNKNAARYPVLYNKLWSRWSELCKEYYSEEA